jgi:CRP-like cAMP-binding protein
MTTPAGGTAAAGLPFGKYVLERRLATGGMAEVFLASTVSGGGVVRTCVIKRILPEFSKDRQFVSMFIDEARILIGLSHPNVVRLYDFGRVEDSYFMALEYVGGCNLVAALQHLFSQGRALDMMPALFVAQEVLRGLHHAHQQTDAAGHALHVVHRDVSPHNVLLSREGDVKVADFGIAQARNRSTRTEPGTVMGKFAYMAPEQAKGEQIDARADVFAVGVLLHEALCGQRLYAANTPAETLVKLLHTTPPLPSRIRPELPGALDDLVRRALEHNPERRWTSAADMADALQTLLEEQGGYGAAKLQRYLRGCAIPELEGTSGGASAVLGQKGGTQPLHVVPKAAQQPLEATQALVVDARLEALRTAFAREADLWTLCGMGQRYGELGQRDLAAGALRVAAVAFAWRGLLVQALAALDQTSGFVAQPAWEQDVHALADIFRGNQGMMTRQVERVDTGGFFRMLQEADPSWKTAQRPTAVPAVPLYGTVEPDMLVPLMRATRVRRCMAGERVVSEGDRGDTLYAVAQGRVVVWCHPPADLRAAQDRIYLSSLSEGDFFGEFGFLAGERRTASVETTVPTVLLEVDRAAVQDVVNAHPRIAGPLTEYYKLRVLELLLAKNPVLAVLAPAQRRALVQSAQPVAVADGQDIIREGEEGDAFFVIRQGEVEVYTEKAGVPIFINKLREGEFFGEMAAIRGTPRGASVRAMGDVELLRIGRAPLLAITREDVGVAAALDRAMNERQKEATQQVKTAGLALGEDW